MKYGFNLPGTLDGRALLAFSRRADELGFESIWSGDHIILPTAGTNQYPYTIDGSFQRPADAPYHEMMTVLSFVAGATERVRIGSTVIILPYRDPVVQAKMFSSLDVLTNGRVVCGVGVGWLEKEFDTLRVPYADRGPMSDECLEVMRCLWTEDEPEFHGRFFDFDGIQMNPKPVQRPHIPIWVGGHTGRALRRTAKYGDAWHPTRQTPDFVAAMLPGLRTTPSRRGGTFRTSPSRSSAASSSRTLGRRKAAACARAARSSRPRKRSSTTRCDAAKSASISSRSTSARRIPLTASAPSSTSPRRLRRRWSSVGYPVSRTTTLKRRRIHALDSSSKLTTSRVPRPGSTATRSPSVGTASGSVCLYTRPTGSPVAE